MQINVSVRHDKLEPAQQQYIEKKAEKLLRLFNRLMEIDVAVDHGKNGWDVEFIVSAEHKNNFTAREYAPSLEAATDQALHKIEHQLRRYKDRLMDHRDEPPQGGTSPTSPDLPEPPESSDTPEPPEAR